jgi:hypothetical protein
MSGSDGQTALRVDNFRRRLATVDQRLAAVNGRLAKEFPGYANLSNPGPLALSRVQALLGPDGSGDRSQSPRRSFPSGWPVSVPGSTSTNYKTRWPRDPVNAYRRFGDPSRLLAKARRNSSPSPRMHPPRADQLSFSAKCTLVPGITNRYCGRSFEMATSWPPQDEV